MSPTAHQVEARKADPPPGAREVGPIEAVHGSGCGLIGEKGSYESALAVLRNMAAEKNADYVQILSMTEPHSEHGCFDQRFIIRGMAFQVRGAAAAPSAPPATTGDGCSPPCSPGYACQASQCIALCNPPCSPGYACANDRTCKPAPADAH
jgi:hypothetical protein